MLKDLRVLQFEGLAPSVFCGMYFADQGANVILVCKKDSSSINLPSSTNLMNRGKRSITLSPKLAKQKQMIEELIKMSHIIIDPYRPGVLQKLGIGPEFIYRHNKSAILLRVSGYGQDGPLALKPGHDLNYISESGIVPIINQNKGKIYEFPANFVADFVSTSLAIIATLSALALSKTTGFGYIVDCSLTHGSKYLAHAVKQVRCQNVDSQKSLAFTKQAQKQYCITKSKMHSSENFAKISRQMNKNGQQYLETDQYSVSQIKNISQLPTEMKNLRNPFASQHKNFKVLQLPTKNQHQKQIREEIEKHLSEKPKL